MRRVLAALRCGAKIVILYLHPRWADARSEAEEVVQRRPEVHLRRLYIGRATLAAPEVAQPVDEAPFELDTLARKVYNAPEGVETEFLDDEFALLIQTLTGQFIHSVIRDVKAAAVDVKGE